MVKCTVQASVAVESGPTLVLNRVLEPDSYAAAQVRLTGSGAGATAELPLLPDAGAVVLLAVKVSQANGQPATVTVTPRNGTAAGTALAVTGSLLVSHPGVLAALVDGGPRTLTLANAGSTPIVVDVLAGLDS